MTATQMRIESLRVDELFGRYSHAITLHGDDRVTIMHGPNGVGKTVLLRLVAAAFTTSPVFLLKTKFRHFEVRFDDGSKLEFDRKEEVAKSGKHAGVIEGTCTYTTSAGTAKSLALRSDGAEVEQLAKSIERYSNWISAVDGGRFYDRHYEEVLDPADLVARYGAAYPDAARNVEPIPGWLRQLRDRVPVHFVEAQRLLNFQTAGTRGRHREWPRPPHAYHTTVKAFAGELQSRIAETQGVYAKQAQQLDQSFPTRVLDGNKSPLLSSDQLKTKLEELEVSRSHLAGIGLIEEGTFGPSNISALETANEAQRAVMSLFVDDAVVKLGVFASLSRKVTLLLDIVNRKFRHKRIRIDRQRGIVAMDDLGGEIDLDLLSSGEQHELVLLYSLLFRVERGALVLIDEPELSLHVNWQKEFLQDLISIAAEVEFDALIATHSPYIVGDRFDLMVELSDAV